MQDGTKRAVVWTAIRGPAPPSTNGFSAAGHRHQTDFGLAPPSTNGFSGSGPPSPNGFWPCATVNKRVQRQRAPVNKRFFGLAPPSTNGFSAAGRRQQTDLCLAPPSTNGFSAAGHRQQTGLSAAGRRQQTVFLVLRHRQQTDLSAAGLRQQTVFGLAPPSTNGLIGSGDHHRAMPWCASACVLILPTQQRFAGQWPPVAGCPSAHKWAGPRRESEAA